MKKEIIITVVGATAGVILTLAAGGLMGMFDKTLTESQLNAVARKIVDLRDRRDVLLKHMEESGAFKGERGPQGKEGPQGLRGPQGVQGPAGPEGAVGSNGPRGIQGVPGPNKNLFCVTTQKHSGPVAICPDGMILTGCSTNSVSGWIHHENNSCVTEGHVRHIVFEFAGPDELWTQAQCCALK